jgi:uncharacterized C2H2 Zn-finger protein
MNIKDITKEDLDKFERIKADTRYDMFDKKARKSVKLTAEKFSIIYNHYEIIKERFDNNGVFKTDSLDVIKCPHCGYIDKHLSHLSFDECYDGRLRCPLCEKRFNLDIQYIKVIYTTTKEEDCEDNNYEY